MEQGNNNSGSRCKFANENDLSYKLSQCNTCGHCNCCHIAPPFLTPEECQAIQKCTDKPVEEFAILKTDGNEVFYVMRQGQDKRCVFFDGSKLQCNIYPVRPLDCRLFPLDICYDGQKFRWVMYNDFCKIKVDKSKLLSMVDSIEHEVLSKLKPYLKDYSTLLPEPYLQGKWTEICEVNEL